MNDNMSNISNTVDSDIITTDQILRWSEQDRENLRKDIESIHIRAFPNMGKEDLEVYIRDYFTPAIPNFQRQVILFRNNTGRLIATNICNHGKIDYDGKTMNGAYLISSAILPEYQGYGIGQIIGVKLLKGLSPEILFTTCAQSAALHARVNLIRKGLVSSYEVYPRLEQKDGKDVLISLPFRDLDFVIHAFRQTYLGVVEGHSEDVEHALRGLTIFMVRKNLYGKMYDFNPWEKHEREDKLAKALGIMNRDGVLVIFRRTA
jgi:hypothetical protein